MPFVVHGEVWRPPGSAENEVWLRVGLQGQELEPVPLHLTFLVDDASPQARRAVRQAERASGNRVHTIPFERGHLHEHLWKAHRLASQAYSPDAVNRVILLSGPDPGLDPAALQALRDEVDTWAGTGISLSTVVFDEHLDLGLMDLGDRQS